MIGGSIIALIVIYVVRTIGGTAFGYCYLNLQGLVLCGFAICAPARVTSAEMRSGLSLSLRVGSMATIGKPLS